MLVAHLPACMEWGVCATTQVSTICLLCVGCFWPLGMWSKLGCMMVPVQVASISNDEPHFFPGAGSSANGLCSVGTKVARRTVLCWCDNQAAVCAIAARSCQDAKMMHLLRCLFFLEACCQFELVASHVPGIHNGLADDLSRNRLSSFFLKVPQACKEPTAVLHTYPKCYWIQASIGPHPVGPSGSILL